MDTEATPVNAPPDGEAKAPRICPVSRTRNLWIPGEKTYPHRTLKILPMLENFPQSLQEIKKSLQETDQIHMEMK
jgi:hypothetical protein